MINVCSILKQNSLYVLRNLKLTLNAVCCGFAHMPTQVYTADFLSTLTPPSKFSLKLTEKPENYFFSLKMNQVANWFDL